MSGFIQARPCRVGRYFSLFFDDGLSSCSEVIAPILYQKGIPATFFLTTHFLNNRYLGFRHKVSLLYDSCTARDQRMVLTVLGSCLKDYVAQNRDTELNPAILFDLKHNAEGAIDTLAEALGIDVDTYLKVQRPYLTDEQVRLLINQGFTIGCHSATHPHYADLSVEKQIEESRTSLRYLEERFPMPVKAFAFPFASDGVLRRSFEELLKMFHLVFQTGWPVLHADLGSSGVSVLRDAAKQFCVGLCILRSLTIHGEECARVCVTNSRDDTHVTTDFPGMDSHSVS